jgi:hypothetical protein
MALLAFDGVVITLTGSRLRMKNLGHNFDLVRLLVYFLFCGVMTYPKMLCARGKKLDTSLSVAHIAVIIHLMLENKFMNKM